MAGQSESSFPLGAALQTVSGVIAVLLLCFVGSALISLLGGGGGGDPLPGGDTPSSGPTIVGSLPPLPTGTVVPVSQDKGLTEDKFALGLQYQQGIAVRGVQNKVCCKYETNDDGERVCVDEKWDDLCPMDQRYYKRSPMNYGLGPIGLPKTFFEILVRQSIKNAQGVTVNAEYTPQDSNEYTSPNNFFNKITGRNEPGQTYAGSIKIFGPQLASFPFNFDATQSGQARFLGSFNGTGVNSGIALQFTQTPDEAKKSQQTANPFGREYDFDYNAFIAGQVAFEGGNAKNWCYPERNGGDSVIPYGVQGGQNDSSQSQVLASSNASDSPAQIARLSLPPELKSEEEAGWIDSITNWLVGSILSVFNTATDTQTTTSWEELVPELYGNMYKPQANNLIYVEFFTDDSEGVICSNKCFRKSPQRVVECICARKWGETCNENTGSRVGCKLNSSFIKIKPLFGDTSERGRPELDIQRSSKTNYLMRTTPEEAKQIEEVQRTITPDDVRKHILKQPVEAKKKAVLDSRLAGDKLFGEIYIIFPVSVFWAVTPPSFYGCTYTTFDGKKILPGVMPVSVNWLVETIESLPPDDESLVLLNLLQQARAAANGDDVAVDSAWVRKAMVRLGFDSYDNIGFDTTTLTFQAPVLTEGSFGGEYNRLVNQAERNCYNPATAGCHEQPPF